MIKLLKTLFVADVKENAIAARIKIKEVSAKR